MKKVMVQFAIPNMTEKQYNQCWEEMRRTGHANPEGLIHHTGALQGTTMLAIDVWESEEAFNKFGGVLMPIFAKFGITPVPPVITPVTYDYTGVTASAIH